MSVPFNTDQFAGPNSPLKRQRIPLDEVLDTQLYANPEKVERMRKTWSRSMAEPVVAERNGRYFVLDGHHRVEAARERGHKWLRARVSA